MPITPEKGADQLVSLAESRPGVGWGFGAYDEKHKPYNNARLHSRLNYLSPTEHEPAYYTQTTTTPTDADKKLKPALTRDGSPTDQRSSSAP